MPDAPDYLARPGGHRLAYRRLDGHGPGVVFLGGFKSDMTGTKALALEQWCRRAGHAYVRFDYFGHGDSSGRFSAGTIGRWRDDAVAVVDQLTAGPQVLVGSSMGGWLMLHVALARSARIHGLIGIAAAADFTEDLIRARLTPSLQAELTDQGQFSMPTDYGPDPYPITRQLLDEARAHLLLRGGPSAIHCPVRLIHGMQDADVPWPTSVRIADKLATDDVRISLVKDGGHRLSRPQDLALIGATLAELVTTSG